MEKTFDPLSLDHLFRHESGKMVSALTRFFGLKNIDLVEDVVQDTLCLALENWKYHGWPENPTGWLYTVAKNKALDSIRRKRLFEKRVLPTVHSQNQEELLYQLEGVFLEGEIKDEVLRMMFVCSHPSLAEDSQIALMLKFVCGFSVSEVAKALLQEEAAVQKKSFRAKKTLMDKGLDKVMSQSSGQVESVFTALYLLFNEGYHSSHSEQAIREDLCFEAFRLTLLLVDQVDEQECTVVYSLLALMSFLAARLPSRSRDDGSLVLLKTQDRSKWNFDLIAEGFSFLEKSKPDEGMSGYPRYPRYHLEAGLAACHCLAKDFESTDWGTMLQLYNRLLEVHPSPIVELNRALVFWQLEGPGRALEEIEKCKSHKALKKYPYYYATLGELNKELSRFPEAKAHFTQALSLAQNPADQKLLKEKLKSLG